MRRRLSDRALHPIAVTLTFIHRGHVDQLLFMNKSLLFPSGAASALVADMEASNGTVHVINAMVMPD